jgi:hemolysin activation/secretion protein
MISFAWKINVLPPTMVVYLSQITIALLIPCALPALAVAQITPGASATIDLPFVPQLLAQTLPRPDFQRPAPLPSDQPVELPRPRLPPPQELLPVPLAPHPTGQPSHPANFPAQITVKRFEIVGGTIFTAAQLAAITAPATNQPLDFAQLLQVASNITQLYVGAGYASSGAYIPGNQSFTTQDGVVKIQIVEGRVADIVVTGNQRLDANYIRSRIAVGTTPPLKIDRLLERLQLLQLDPLIANISAELVTGKETGTSDIQVNVTEAPTKRVGLNLVNNRTPSIGEIQGQISFGESNLLGIGDAIGLTTGGTEAGNILDFNYTVPLNPHNGTMRLQYSKSNSRVIEAPFQPLDINANAQELAVTYRQPVMQTLTKELAMGVTLTQRESNISYLPTVTGSRIGFPSPGADRNGRTSVTAARFFQDFTTRDTQQVFALRSQLSVGLNALGATVNTTSPDGQFLSWRGQAQYVRVLAPDSSLVLKIDSQFADRPLVPLEQISWGGQDTVRGYRQDLLLGDNGLLASAEMRVPIWRTPGSKQLLQIVPFIDYGVVWNNQASFSTASNSIAAIGLGLRYQSDNNFLAKLDYGIPLIAADTNAIRRTGQEQGFYFSLSYNLSF